MREKEFALLMAKKAGKIIKKNFKIGMDRTIKEDTSPVTETDIAVNKMIIKESKKYFPSYGVKGEEESSMSGKEEYLWVCDPVDGTIPFSHGIPTCTFSLALVKNGEPVLGVAYDPFIDRMFFAEKGKGAFLNGEKILVSKQNKIDNCLITLEGGKRSPFRLDNLFVELRNRGSKVLVFASVVYAGVLVACGELGATVFGWNTAHDIAALKVIVEEAGGKVTDLYGNEQRYDGKLNGALVSNGVLHDELLKLIKEKVLVEASS
jgi:fructose-1,6-bisphosphatase/inositol monophosphatase family enzyme